MTNKHKKNRCYYCGSTDIKHLFFLFVQCNNCSEAQGLQDLISDLDIPLNNRKVKHK